MAASIVKGKTFGSTEEVTNTSLHTLVDSATISGIVNAEIAADAAIVDTKLAQITTASKVSTTAITELNNGTINPTNLLSNGNFENWSAGTTSVPDGWALVLTPTLARDTGDTGYGSYSAKVTAAGAALEGISFSLTGLKASTTYSVSWRTKVTAGDTSEVVTTGGGTNLSATDSTSTTFETKTGTFITDASGTTVVLKLLAKVDGDIVWFDGIMVVQGASAFAFSDKPAGEGVWSDYFATSTITGWAATPTGNIYIKKIGKTVFVSYSITGTSNLETTQFTVPYTSATGAVYQTCGYTLDNGTATTTGGAIGIGSASSTVGLTKTMADTATDWTASGTKTVKGILWYEAA